jgi:hypothetical protein
MLYRYLLDQRGVALHQLIVPFFRGARQQVHLPAQPFYVLVLCYQAAYPLAIMVLNVELLQHLQRDRHYFRIFQQFNGNGAWLPGNKGVVRRYKIALELEVYRKLLITFYKVVTCGPGIEEVDKVLHLALPDQEITFLNIFNDKRGCKSLPLCILKRTEPGEGMPELKKIAHGPKIAKHLHIRALPGSGRYWNKKKA